MVSQETIAVLWSSIVVICGPWKQINIKLIKHTEAEKLK